MVTQIIEKTQLTSTDSYQLIKDEHLASVVISAQILAGSRILLSSYSQVVFSECSFYACEFQGVIFENCVFENCSFEFSHIKKCKFINCNFTNCKWNVSTSTKSVYDKCVLNKEFMAVIQRGGNELVKHSHDHSTDIYIEMLVA